MTDNDAGNVVHLSAVKAMSGLDEAAETWARQTDVDGLLGRMLPQAPPELRQVWGRFARQCYIEGTYAGFKGAVEHLRLKGNGHAG